MSTKRQEVKSKVLQLAKEGKIEWNPVKRNQLEGWVGDYTILVFANRQVFWLEVYNKGSDVEFVYTVLTGEEYAYLSEQQEKQYREREERLQQQAEHQIDEFLNLVP